MIIAQHLSAGAGGSTTFAFSPVETAEAWSQKFSRPYGTQHENYGERCPSTEVLGYFQLPRRGSSAGKDKDQSQWTLETY